MALRETKMTYAENNNNRKKKKKSPDLEGTRYRGKGCTFWGAFQVFSVRFLSNNQKIHECLHFCSAASLGVKPLKLEQTRI